VNPSLLITRGSSLSVVDRREEDAIYLSNDTFSLHFDLQKGIIREYQFLGDILIHEGGNVQLMRAFTDNDRGGGFEMENEWRELLVNARNFQWPTRIQKVDFDLENGKTAKMEFGDAHRNFLFL